MCGRFEILTVEEVADAIAAVEEMRASRLKTIANRAQARPGSNVLLFGQNGEGTQLEIDEATWGFDPEWSTKPVFNTRIESMASGSAMWRDVAENGRCIIPAASFYEPHATETVPSPRTGKPIKRPYQFSNVDGSPLLLAGVRDGGRCSIVTCEPNRWVSPIHNRMPLALRFEEVGAWLSPNWLTLADRTNYELNAAPELLSEPPQSDQLSLF